MAGRIEHAASQRVGGHHQQRPVPVDQLGELSQILYPAVEVGVLDHQAGRIVTYFRLPVAYHLDCYALGLAIGTNHLEINGGNRIRNCYAAPAGDPARHQHTLGQAGCSVIHSGVGHVHAEKAADEGLEFVDYLKRALAYLGLIGGVGGQEFATGHQRFDDGGYESGGKSRRPETMARC